MPGDSPHYPTTLPDLTDLREVVNDVDDVVANDHNDPIKEIIAMAGELGSLPKGDYTTIKDRFTAIEHKSACRVYRGTSDQTIGDHSTTKIEWNAATFDNLSEFDITTNHRFIAATAGIYAITGSLRMKLLTADTNVFIYAKVNGTTIEQYAIAPTKVSWWSFHFAFTIKMTKAQYFEIFMYHEDGSGKALHANGAYTWLSITKLQN